MTRSRSRDRPATRLKPIDPDLDAEVYLDDRVTRMIQENFVSVRVHVRDQAEEFRRLGGRYVAHWTPAVLILDPQGQERHRVEGFLPWTNSSRSALSSS